MLPREPDRVTALLADGALYLTATAAVVALAVWLGRSLGWWQ